MKRALQFASQYTTISQQDRDIILHARKQVNVVWARQGVDKERNGFVQCDHGLLWWSRSMRTCGYLRTLHLIRQAQHRRHLAAQRQRTWRALECVRTQLRPNQERSHQDLRRYGADNNLTKRLEGSQFLGRDAVLGHREALPLPEAKWLTTLLALPVQSPTKHHPENTRLYQLMPHGHLEWQSSIHRSQSSLQ